MKTVWILNHYAQEPGGPGGTRHFSLARHLREHGWRAIIIASSVEHGTGRQRLADGERFRLDSYDGVTFLWLRGNSYTGNGGDRIRNMLGYTLAALRVPSAVLPAPDIVVGSSVHPFAAWAGARLASRFGVPFIFEIRDLWPQTLIDMGRLKSHHPMALALGRLEKSLCHKACRVVTLLPKADQYLQTIGVSPDRVVWVSNGVEITDRTLPAPLTGERAFVLMYFGAHGSANGLENALLAMERLQREALPVRLRLIGDGPAKSRLVQLARELALANVSFEPPVRKSDIPSLASEADAFIFNLIDAPVFKYGISSNKLFDYMGAQRPVIFCCNSSNNPVMDAGAGLTVPPEQPDALAEAIRALIVKDAEERAAMGLAGRRHVQAHYSYRMLADKFAGILNECANSV